jgi:RNA polymerase sigma-70 factor (ECF subfamily)
MAATIDEPDDIRCISETLQGRVRSFNEIIIKYQDRIYTFIVKSIGSRDDAKDITQTVFVNAFTSLKRFRHKCSFQTWLYRIAINQVKNYWRNRKNRFVFSESELAQPFGENGAGAGGITGAHTGNNEESRLLVNDLLSRLPLDQRHIFVLYYVIGHTCQEIAEITKLSPSNVKIQLHRGRQFLFEKFGNKL